MLPKNIPDDINIEVLLPYLSQRPCKVVFDGTHKRNAYNDFVGLEELSDETLLLSVGRPSLYNVLPELLFHPMDRFDNLTPDDKEKFEGEYEAQEREKNLAHDLFAPVDLLLLKLRIQVREKLQAYLESDKIMIDILGDTLTDSQKQNRFIKRVLPFLPFCKSIRGDKTYLTLILRKTLMEEGVALRVDNQKNRFTDAQPQYPIRLDEDADSLYLGNTYDEQAITYTIHYWPEDDCDENFPQFLEDLEVFRQFIQDYFIAVDGVLQFDISHDEAPLRLSDETTYNYMNYNMNI